MVQRAGVTDEVLLRLAQLTWAPYAPWSSASTTVSRHESRSSSMCGRAISGTLDVTDASEAAERRKGPSRYSSRWVVWARKPFSVISASVRRVMRCDAVGVRVAGVVLEPREGPAGWRSVVAAPAAGEIAFWQPKERQGEDR